jgi:hypothetical protein
MQGSPVKAGTSNFENPSQVTADGFFRSEAAE